MEPIAFGRCTLILRIAQGGMADALSAFLVGRGYARSERAMSEFLAGLFDRSALDVGLHVAVRR